METVFTQDLWIRPALFFVSFGFVFAAECRWTLRNLKAQWRNRWVANLGLFLLNILMVRLIFVSGAITFATYAHKKNLGLFNLIKVEGIFLIVVSVLILDLTIYFQHRLMHRVPILWRLHKVHHADPNFDLSTGLRFHPLEIFFSLLIKGLVIILLGIPAQAVLIFEVLLNSASIFTHANFRLNPALEGPVRWFIVTPSMHRVHHSVILSETNSNFGFLLSSWDRSFGTYIPKSVSPSETEMAIGIKDLSGRPESLRVWGLLKMPFR